MLRWLCARYSIPIVFIGETFSDSNSLLRRFLKQPLRKYYFRGVSRFVAIGEKTSRYYQSLSVGTERIVQARYCTDVSFFRLSPEEAKATRRRWRKEMGLPEDAFVLLFVGRLFERKRPQDMIRLHQALKRDPRIHTVIVGNGPMEAALRGEGITEERLYFAGFRNQGQTRECYYGSDLLVVPSESETWGLVANEAFACGRPAIVTEQCGTAGDLVVHGETGFVYPVGDTSCAAALIAPLVGDPSSLARLGEEARRKVSSEYSIGQFAEAILQALEGAASETRSPVPAAG
jgi:glycosyltransferase involved in cell wall biosynthesis